MTTSETDQFARLLARVSAQFRLRGGRLPMLEIRQAADAAGFAEREHEVRLYLEGCLGARRQSDDYIIPALANNEDAASVREAL